MQHRSVTIPGHFHCDPRAEKAGNAALGLWARAAGWAALSGTPEFIPNHIVEQLGTPAQAKRLVNAQLWAQTVGGYAFTTIDRSNINNPAEALAKGAERARSYRARKKLERETAAQTV